MLLVEEKKATVNRQEIGRGTLICAKYDVWDDWESGIVESVTDSQIIVLHLPETQNVRTLFNILASEMENGEWKIRYSNDGMKTVQTFGEEDEDGPHESGT